MRKMLSIGGLLLAFALTAAGSFWGGMQYQERQSEQVQADFFRQRGELAGGQFPDQPPAELQEGQMPGQQPGGFGSGTIGVIKSIDGDVLTLSTAGDVTTVSLSDTSRVNRTDTVTLAELEAGMRVSVVGERDENGTLVASVISILNTDAAGPPLGEPYPPPGELEP